jgi:hypothetical protein
MDDLTNHKPFAYMDDVFYSHVNESITEVASKT